MKSPKIPTNFDSIDFYSAGSHNFCSAPFYSSHFCDLFALKLGVPTTQSSKDQTNFCSAHFYSALTFLHLTWRIPCRVLSYHSAVSYTHSLGLEPHKDPTCVKPIVADTSGNQSSTQVHQYLKMNLG